MWLPDLADPTWMADVLSRHAGTLGLPSKTAGVQLLDVRLTHPHRPETPRCRGWATYVVTPSDAAPVQLYVKGFPAGGVSETAWQLDRATRPAGRSTHLPDVDLVVWRFPEDPRLAALPDLVAPGAAARIMPAAVRDVLGLQAEDELRTTVVRYQPEASATLRLEVGPDGGPAVFAKHLADGTVADVGARHRVLWSLSGAPRDLRIPEPLGTDPARGVLWTRGVAGRPLVAATVTDQLPAATASLGALLAALHAAPVEIAQRLVVDDLLVEANKKAAKLVRAHPAVSPLVTDLVTTATRRRREVVNGRVCTLHGDFHLDQLVSSAQGPVLVDLDSIVRGPPEIDLAEFLVDLALRGLPGAVAQEVARGLMSSYAAASGTEIDAALLAICADAEFVNRCYRHLRRHAPGWQSALETELGRHADMRSLLQA